MTRFGFRFAVFVAACGLGSSAALAADMAMKAPMKAAAYLPSSAGPGSMSAAISAAAGSTKLPPS